VLEWVHELTSGASDASTVGHHAAVALWSPFTGLQARLANRIRKTSIPQNPHRALPRWQRWSGWSKVDNVLSNKYVRGAGVVGAAAGTVSSFGDHRAAGDSATEAALKTGVETGFTALGASTFAAGGVVCGPAAAACGAGLGVVGAGVGSWVGGKVTTTFEGEFEWTAGKLEDAGNFVSGIDYTPWN
jgi:hypothetical protein